jgi:adhesin transport system outer membrane protein
MVFDGFATSSEVGRQQATVNSRAYSLLGTSERTALTVAQVYLDVLTRREFVRLAEENLKSHQRIYDQINCAPSAASAVVPTSIRPKRGWPRLVTT